MGTLNLLNLQLQDAETSSGESEVKFQVSKDTLGAMLRSMAYIREQLSNVVTTSYYDYIFIFSLSNKETILLSMIYLS